MKNFFHAFAKQLNAALAGEEEMHSIVKSGSIKVVDCSPNVLTEFRDKVTKKINPKHNKDEPVVLSLPLGIPLRKNNKMVPYPGTIARYPANMSEHYASELSFKRNVPGQRRAKQTFTQTSWNVITLDDRKNWDCEPVYVQSPPDYHMALEIDEYNKEKDPLWAALTEAGAGNSVVDLVSNVGVLDGVIQITLAASDEDSGEEDSEDEDSGDERDVPHFYWDPVRSVYISLSGMTAHAEASRAISSFKPFSFTICEGRFTFNQEMYCWINNTSSKFKKSQKRGTKDKLSPSTHKKVSVYSFKVTRAHLLSAHLLQRIMVLIIFTSCISANQGGVQEGKEGIS